MTDGATRYGYGDTVQVFTAKGLVLAAVIGPKECGKMLVALRDERRLVTVMPYGNGWVEVRRIAAGLYTPVCEPMLVG